jgi:lysozyme
MKTSAKAPAAVLATAIVAGLLVFVPPREGRRNEAYPDPAHGWAVPTICHGHTDAVKRGDTATDAQCLAFLEEDIRRIALPAVLRHVRVPISVDQGVALGDFAFNVGERAFARSTLVRRLNAGDCLGAAREFGAWVHAGGKRLPGLV